MKNKLADMMCLDIYLSSLTNKEHQQIKDQIGRPKWKPLLSWDIFTNDFQKRIAESKKRTELRQVLSFAKKFNWKNNLNLTFSENDYKALIITDKNQHIIWVNNGFSTMTGYSKTFALNKTPRFLQGAKTTVQTKNRFKNKIALDQPFKDVIINHRKDNSTYKCEVKIYPLYNKKTTHYIAFEKEII